MSLASASLEELRKILARTAPRIQKLREIAALIRSSGNYRWVGLYEIDRQAGEVINLVWDGPGAPEYPRFPIGKGLTGAAIQERKVLNIGEVASDPRYLTAFGSTRSEIIVPILMRTALKRSGQSTWKANERMHSMRKQKSSL